MPVKDVEARKVKRRGEWRWRVIVPKELNGGLRRVRYFGTKEDAADFARECENSRASVASEFFTLSSQTQSALLRAARLMGDRACELEEAAAEWLRQEQTLPIALSEIIADCLEEKKAAGMRSRYMQTLKWSLSNFQLGRESKQVAEIKAQEISTWLNGNGWKAATRRSVLTDVRTLFNFAKKRGYVTENPAMAIDKPLFDEKPPGILKVDECSRLLKACLKVDKALVRFLAVQLFGGLRPVEAQALSADEVNGTVEVKAAKSKTRRRRLVTINDTLKAWLDVGGDLPASRSRTRLLKVRAATAEDGKEEIPWPHDCLRHTFVSYALPVWGAARTAVEAGHSETILFAHYREVVTREEADAFWALRP